MRQLVKLRGPFSRPIIPPRSPAAPPATGYDLAANWFGGSEVGFYIDPSDTSTLWTDAGRTTNVTADGQTVLQVDDASGNGNNSVAAQCTYRTSGGLHWLETDDGAGDFIQLPSIAWSSSQYLSIAMGVRKTTTDGGRILFEGGLNWNDNDSFNAVVNGSGELQLGLNRTNRYCLHATPLALNADAAVIFYGDRLDGPGEIKRAELGGVAIPNTRDDDLLDDPFDNLPVYIGARAGVGLGLSMRLYGLAIAGAQISDTDLNSAGNLMHEKFGGSGAGPF